MNVDPRDTVNTSGTNPNRGMQTRPYMLTLFVALVLILLLLLIFVLHRRSASGPATSPAAPATGLVSGTSSGLAA